MTEAESMKSPSTPSKGAARIVEADPKENSEAVAEILQVRARALAKPLSDAGRAEERSVVSFKLGDERYAVDAEHVKEIVVSRSLTSLPGVPVFITGVTNLGGQLLAVVDLRPIFSLPTEPAGPTATVLVVEVSGKRFGLLVDHAVEARRIVTRKFEVLANNTANGTRFLQAVGEDFTQVLDVHLLVSSGAILVNQEIA
jgi:purine-binding chemotaxis protein CheW